MTEHPDVATATAAMEVKRLFDTYGDPTSLAQTEESGVLHNLIQDLKALDAEKARLLALTPWINNLENKEKAFKEAFQKNGRKVESHRRCREAMPFRGRQRLQAAGEHRKRPLLD